MMVSRTAKLPPANHHPLNQLRETRLYSVRLREQGGAGTDTFFVEGIDLADAVERAKAIAKHESTVDLTWEAEFAEYAGIVRRIWPELR